MIVPSHSFIIIIIFFRTELLTFVFLQMDEADALEDPSANCPVPIEKNATEVKEPENNVHSSTPAADIVVPNHEDYAAESTESSITLAQIAITTIGDHDDVENMVTNAQPPPIAATKTGSGPTKLQLNLKKVSSDRDKSIPFKNSEQRKKSARLSSVQDDNEKKLKPEEVSP
jgi:hypothetical protein